MKTMKFGIIGCGLMGREFASATLRWAHLQEEITKPEIIGVCDMNPASFSWFDKALPLCSTCTASAGLQRHYQRWEAPDGRKALWYGQGTERCNL